MRYGLTSLFLAIFAATCFAQKDGVAPVTVEGHAWQADKQVMPKPPPANIAPAKELTPDDKLFERKVRESQMRGSMQDPGETTPDGRRAALDKITEEARASQMAEDIKGYLYRASFRNNTDQLVRVIYWEYRFIERANQGNVVKRHFLCAANIKPGDKRELSVFSVLGPTGVISTDTLLRPDDKRFVEEVWINRIELSDDSVIQRRDFKFSDIKKAAERATSTRWSPTEVCRAI